MNEELLKIRHSASHVLATAVLRLFPNAKLDIGPATETGFYYDFDLDHKFTAEDLVAIEAEMKKVISENQRFERTEVDRATATKMIEDMGQTEFKLGRLADVPEGEKITMYRNGEFCDLCAGPHVDYTKRIKAFKLLSIAGAYHRGDENNKQLQPYTVLHLRQRTSLRNILSRWKRQNCAITVNSAKRWDCSR